MRKPNHHMVTVRLAKQGNYVVNLVQVGTELFVQIDDYDSIKEIRLTDPNILCEMCRIFELPDVSTWEDEGGA